jgi:O-antigen ligase
LGLTLSQLIAKPMEIFNGARAESSKDRELVVRKTLEAWQESPWVGWGIIQGSVKWYTYNIALGSFSTYASVLYLHGIVGFIVFIAALALTLWSFWGLAVRGNPLCKRAFASLVALYLLCNATPLTWMTVYFWFFFVWLGAILSEIQPPDGSITSWEQLAGDTEARKKFYQIVDEKRL